MEIVVTAESAGSARGRPRHRGDDPVQLGEARPRAIDRSRESLGLMNQNIALIAAPNAAGLGAAVASGINPAVAAFLSNGSTVLAAANGLRPLLKRPERSIRAA